jgi:phenylalanyl-tRNA synthetase beta chain
VAVGVLGLAPLLEASTGGVALRDVPRLPPVRRDLAFLVRADVPAGAVAAAIDRGGGTALTRSDLFDVFEGPPLPEGTRSLAFAIELRDPDRTMTDEQAKVVVDEIVAAVAQATGGTLRAD